MTAPRILINKYSHKDQELKISLQGCLKMNHLKLFKLEITDTEGIRNILEILNQATNSSLKSSNNEIKSRYTIKEVKAYNDIDCYWALKNEYTSININLEQNSLNSNKHIFYFFTYEADKEFNNQSSPDPNVEPQTHFSRLRNYSKDYFVSNLNRQVYLENSSLPFIYQVNSKEKEDNLIILDNISLYEYTHKSTKVKNNDNDGTILQITRMFKINSYVNRYYLLNNNRITTSIGKINNIVFSVDLVNNSDSNNNNYYFISETNYSLYFNYKIEFSNVNNNKDYLNVHLQELEKKITVLIEHEEKQEIINSNTSNNSCVYEIFNNNNNNSIFLSYSCLVNDKISINKVINKYLGKEIKLILVDNNSILISSIISLEKNIHGGLLNSNSVCINDINNLITSFDNDSAYSSNDDNKDNTVQSNTNSNENVDSHDNENDIQLILNSDDKATSQANTNNIIFSYNDFSILVNLIKENNLSYYIQLLILNYNDNNNKIDQEYLSILSSITDIQVNLAGQKVNFSILEILKHNFKRVIFNTKISINQKETMNIINSTIEIKIISNINKEKSTHTMFLSCFPENNIKKHYIEYISNFTKKSVSLKIIKDKLKNKYITDREIAHRYTTLLGLSFNTSSDFDKNNTSIVDNDNKILALIVVLLVCSIAISIIYYVLNKILAKRERNNDRLKVFNNKGYVKNFNDLSEFSPEYSNKVYDLEAETNLDVSEEKNDKGKRDSIDYKKDFEMDFKF